MYSYTRSFFISNKFLKSQKDVVMKQCLTVICLSGITFYCQAAPQQLASAIKAVTVYSDRAVITRHAEIELTAGEHELVFENLPARLDNNSLQVAANATVPTTILDVTSVQTRLTSNANERLETLDKQITDINEQLAKLNDQQQVLTNQLDFINKMQASTTNVNDKVNRPTATQLQQVMDLSSQSMQELLQEQRQITANKEQLTKELQVLQQQRYPIQQERDLQIKNVTVRVALAKAGKLKLDLDYLTYGASWYPLYDARLNTKTQQLNLGYLANVSQQTGEDWHHVKLTLSTARPTLAGNAPELNDWKLTERKTYPTGIYSNAELGGRQVAYKETATKQSADMKRKVKKSYKPAIPQYANIENSTTSAAFKITEPTSLISGANQQKVTIAALANLKSDLLYQIVPRLRQTAFLQADTTNNSDYPLIAGQLNIFMDGRFIATSQLKTTMPHESFKLDLGADEGIAVNFKEVKRFTEKTGLTNSGERITYQYEITVQNNKPQEVKVQISDHMPVSQNDNIKVKLISPNGIKPDPEGKLVWDKTLKTAEKQQIPVSFTVDYPVKTKVIGL